ncbi:MAG: hypothetical protein H6577_02970 [Lewinellaceae bacterium]|nr:hypothetical protein [Saprospiraceae bacterium]MCB9337073.1 hypothetical protein [Lewinellaceae bacterium]
MGGQVGSGTLKPTGGHTSTRVLPTYDLYEVGGGGLRHLLPTCDLYEVILTQFTNYEGA